MHDCLIASLFMLLVMSPCLLAIRTSRTLD